MLVSDINGNASWGPVPNGVWQVTVDDEIYSSANGDINANVGIGTNNPASRLDVRGDVSITEGLEVTSATGSNVVAVLGTSADGQGIRGVSSNDIGVVGSGGFSGGNFSSQNGTGLSASTQANAFAAVRAIGPRLGVFGTASATSGTSFAIYGICESTSGSGVRGESKGTGVYGSSDVSATGGIGVRGASLASSGGGIGVRGSSNSTAGFDFYADGAGTDYGAASSRRWKNDIVEIDNPIEKLSKVRGVYYTWDEAHGGSRDVGMIAEEVGVILPEIVKYEPNGVDAIGMDYGKMTPLLVQVAKEQQKIIDQERAKVVQLENQLQSLTQRFALLEAAIENNNSNGTNERAINDK